MNQTATTTTPSNPTTSNHIAENWNQFIEIQKQAQFYCRSHFSADDWEDVYQQGLERFLKKHRGEHDRNRRFWYFKACCKHEARKKEMGELMPTPRKRKIAEEIEKQTVSVNNPVLPIEYLADDRRSALDTMLEAEAEAGVWGMVKRLNPAAQRIIEHIRREDLGFEEAAEREGWTAAQFSLVLRDLRKAMGNHPARRATRSTERKPATGGQLALFAA